MLQLLQADPTVCAESVAASGPGPGSGRLTVMYGMQLAAWTISRFAMSVSDSVLRLARQQVSSHPLYQARTRPAGDWPT